MRRILLPAALALLAAGCAGHAPVAVEQVTVHESVTSAPPRFETIQRLWVGSWRSAFGVPSYDSEKDAVEAFKQYAASRGGNGVINFGCYRKSAPGASLACNGTIVRFTP